MLILLASGGGLLDVEPGKGKTVMALNIISKLNVKPLLLSTKFPFESMERESSNFYLLRKLVLFKAKYLIMKTKTLLLV